MSHIPSCRTRAGKRKKEGSVRVSTVMTRSRNRQGRVVGWDFDRLIDIIAWTMRTRMRRDRCEWLHCPIQVRTHGRSGNCPREPTDTHRITTQNPNFSLWMPNGPASDHEKIQKMLPVGVEPTISTLLVWRLTNLAIEAVINWEFNILLVTKSIHAKPTTKAHRSDLPKKHTVPGLQRNHH